MDGGSPITGVRTVGIPVTDQDRAVEFYGEVLGLQVRVDVPLPQLGGRWIELAPAGAVTTIALAPALDGTPAGVQTGIRFATLDAAEVHQALADQGIEVGELLRWRGVPAMFEVRDPDGNTFEIVEQS